MSRKDKAGIVNLQFKWLWKSEAILKKTFTFCTQRVGRKSKIRPKTQLRVQSNQEKLDYLTILLFWGQNTDWKDRESAGVQVGTSETMWPKATKIFQNLLSLKKQSTLI